MKVCLDVLCDIKITFRRSAWWPARHLEMFGPVYAILILPAMDALDWCSDQVHSQLPFQGMNTCDSGFLEGCRDEDVPAVGQRGLGQRWPGYLVGAMPLRMLEWCSSHFAASVWSIPSSLAESFQGQNVRTNWP